RSPFQIVYGRNPKGVLDLIVLPGEDETSDDAEAFAEHILQLQDEVRENLKVSNAQYKSAADASRRVSVFEEGYMVMVHLRKERFPKGTYNKLKYKKIGPCRILKKMSDNAYKVELPENFAISPVFNVSELYKFPGHDQNFEEEEEINWKQTDAEEEKGK
ncbi:hypothetical protein KI387_040713, partial [Taxus chinensis]